MDVESGPTFFARPTGERVPLEVGPKLACWERADHPDQIRLQAYLAYAEVLLRPRIDGVDGPLALSLEVALPSGVPLLEQRDLDNYLLPLASRLRSSTGRDVVSVWATKSTGPQSYVTVGPAEAVAESPAGPEFQVATSASSETVTFKKQVHDQLARALPLAEGPVALELAFEVGPGRNWMNLWKPTIDSLDPLLGPTIPGKPFHPRDGRIVDLGLHCTVDPSRGHEVFITIVPRLLGGAAS